MIVAFGGLGLGATVVSERFEGVFTAISLTVGLASLGPAFLRVHRDPIPLVLFACGLAALAISRLLAAPPIIERWIVLLAAGLLILAHRRNHRACSRCGVCAGIERHRAGGR